MCVCVCVSVCLCVCVSKNQKIKKKNVCGARRLKKKLKIIPDFRIRTNLPSTRLYGPVRNPEFVRRPCGIPGIIIRKFGIRTVFLKMVDRKLKKIK